MAKIVVVGLDGLSPELVKLWGSDLPNLSKMQSEGIWGEVQSTIPPLCAPAWTCAQTGLGPGKYGFWDAAYRDEFSYGLPETADSDAIRPSPLHKYLSFRRAKKVAIINAPLSSPPPEVPGGYAIADFTASDSQASFTAPASLKNEVDELVGGYLPELSMLEVNDPNADKNQMKERIQKVDTQRFTVLNHFITTKKCDYIFCAISGTRNMASLFYSDSKDVLKDYYKFIDAQIGEVRASLDPATILFVHSDHDMHQLEGRINLNEWLIDNGYMSLHEYPQAPTAMADLKVDWSNTKAWSMGGAGQIYVNVKGRELEGIVEPSDCGAVLDELTAKLTAITGQDGKPLNASIYKRDNIHQGPLSEYGPDMFVNFDDYRWHTNEQVGFGRGTIHASEAPQGRRECGPGLSGYFCAAGPGVSAEGQKSGATMLDIAPTLLTMLDEEVPAEMEGKSLVAAGTFANQAEAVLNRLAALGY